MPSRTGNWTFAVNDPHTHIFYPSRVALFSPSTILVVFFKQNIPSFLFAFTSTAHFLFIFVLLEYSPQQNGLFGQKRWYNNISTCICLTLICPFFLMICSNIRPQDPCYWEPRSHQGACLLSESILCACQCSIDQDQDQRGPGGDTTDASRDVKVMVICITKQK